MGKSLPSPDTFLQLTKTFSSSCKPKHTKAVPVNSLRPSKFRGDLVNVKKMEKSPCSFSLNGQNRVPLAQVVSDCVKRWFQDTLKEAKAGDIAMQVLVGQMYHNGYGVPKDAQKGRAWINRASHARASAWKVSDKHPGYNAGDSESNEAKVDRK